ncbi:MAG TPA: anaerobic ribonucleoside-triphosphate reductase activating protein, partial [Anaerolineae bacterium]|nr:anaerobic ribonucleoside-triphosphate reductase activating protein [Anaerolineae bacterium]
MNNPYRMKIIQKSLCNVPIAGIQALTTIDFPGKISAVFFTKGCPWQCRYCHNPSLRLLDTDNLLSGDYVKEFLRKRIGYLEGVVISGGEPTIHASLPRLLTWIRGLDYATALHTNGCFPEMLYLLIKKRLVNYVALDIKAPPKAYDRITQGLNT